MKSSLWIVIVLVTGIVGFLVGYSVSSSTTTAVGGAHKETARQEAAPKPDAAPGYGSAPAAGKASPAPGYGAQPAPAKAVSAGGYR